MGHIGARLARFRREEDGVALVEFALSLPLVLVLFFSIIEGSRMMWGYQAASAGVRDAARYLARVTPREICDTGGSVTGYSNQLLTIVRDRTDGSNIFPNGMTVNAVTPSYTCNNAGSWRDGTAPIAQVSASVTITMPFGGVFRLVGDGTALPTINTTITDQNRVYGS